MVAGMVVIASVSGIFHVARSQGAFKAHVSVSCMFIGTIGEECSLYVDGEIVASRRLNPAQPQTYNGQQVDQCSFNIEVVANRKHDFRVMSTEGELSNKVTEFTQFGKGTTVYLSTFGNKTNITVKGLFTGNNSSPAASLYIDGVLVETQHGEVPNRMEYEFTEEVYLRRHYIVKVMAYSYWEGELSNQTLVYVDRLPVNVSLDLGHPDRKSVV